MNPKFFSRKFIVTILVTVLAFIIPMIYVKFGIDSMVTMAVLGIVGASGAAYGVINVKDKAP